MTRKSDPIHKVTLASGKVRYRFVIDVAKKGDGKRDQRTFTYDTKKEAQAERAKIIAAQSIGTYVKPTKLTLDEFLDQWMAGKRNLRKSAVSSYNSALKTPRERLGSKVLMDVTKADLDGLVNWMSTDGRRVGNRKRTSLAPRTVNLTLVLLVQAFEDAVKQGLLGRNVAALVEKLTEKPKETNTWTAKEATAFLAFVAEDRLCAAWVMTLYGLRRGEVCGIGWEDIDLEGRYAEDRGLEPGTPNLNIRTTRLAVEGEVIEEDPKTIRSGRALPLDEILVAALKKLKVTQAKEHLAAGAAYEDSGLLVVNELGHPYRPEWYGDRFVTLSKLAGVTIIRLHDARHTAATLMHLLGVPIAVISAWLGHASAAFTMRRYVHSQNPELVGAGNTLMRAIRAA